MTSISNTARQLSLTFVTSNQNKLREVQAILGNKVNLEAHTLDLPEYQGNTHTISTEKCKLAAKLLQRPVITEDTCLCFNALSGLPGPFIKWFVEGVGLDGLNKMLTGFEDKSGYALCTFAYCEGVDHEPILFEGRTDGTIVAARGPNKFGWDPIFEPVGFNQTYAEMDSSVKNSISHRSRALAKLHEFLKSKADNADQS